MLHSSFFACCSAAFGKNDFRTAEKRMLQGNFCSATFRKLQRNFRFRLWHVAEVGFRGVGFSLGLADQFGKSTGSPSPFWKLSWEGGCCPLVKIPCMTYPNHNPKGLVAQCSATPASVAATPPCSATPFQRHLDVRHSWQFEGATGATGPLKGGVARYCCYT